MKPSIEIPNIHGSSFNIAVKLGNGQMIKVMDRYYSRKSAKRGAFRLIEQLEAFGSRERGILADQIAGKDGGNE